MDDIHSRLSGMSEDKKALFKAMLEERRRSAGSPEDASSSVIRPLADDSDAPLSYEQQRLWFQEKRYGPSPAYNVATAFWLQGTIDREALERSLERLAARHDALRLGISLVEGVPVQNAIADPEIRLSWNDTSRMETAQAEQAALGLANADARRPFDLAAPPLMRAGLIRVADERHLFHVTLHHVACDGWSLEIFFRELSNIYASELEARDSDIPALTARYVDYAAWQRQREGSEAIESQIRYWKERLDGAPDMLRLPLDRARPEVQTFRGAKVFYRYAPHIVERLRALAERRQATPFMAALAAWQVLLSRYSQQSDIVVGTPVSLRGRAELEAVIGFFVNTVAIRSGIEEDAPFTDLLDNVRDRVLEAFGNQDAPFDRVVEELRAERSPAHSPVFQVMFAYHRSGTPDFKLGAADAEPVELDTAAAKTDLTLELLESPDGLVGSFEYNRDLFEESTVLRMARHYGVLLQAVVADATHRIRDLPLIDGDERRDLVERWNRTGRHYPRDKAVSALFAEQVGRAPGRIAVRHGGTELTYGELDERSNRLARYLQSKGVGRGDLVSVCLDRSPDLIVGLLAIAKTGAAYVPLDAEYPAERLRFMLRDSGARVLLSDRRHALRLPGGGGCTVVLLDEEASAIAGQQASPLDLTALDGQDRLYVMYTSGSTGQPKGIEIRHCGVTRLVLNTDYIEWQDDDRVAQASNVSFDAATFEIWGALLNGVALVIAERETLLDPEALGEWLAAERIRVLFLTTALFNRMARARNRGLAGLRVLLFGGEAVDMRCVRQVWDRNRPERLLHVYGPTEATTFATWRPVGVEDLAEGATAPIGLPIANTELYLLDAQRQLTPLGVPGEIYLGGDGLAKGYWNRPELTAEKFIEHPWKPGARLYRTGDLGRRRADGAIEFLGRIDDQVKIRGFRIELGEVEAALRSEEGVRDCIVVVRDDGSGDKTLVAYAAVGDSTLDGAELRRRLRDRLPAFMTPAVVATLPSLPLTPNGKIDRAALPDPADVAAEPTGDYLAPQGELERALSEIWRDVLRVERVGRYDNFFDLGGHSLLLTEVHSRIRQSHDSISLVDLFQYPTVASLAGYLSGGADESAPANSDAREEGPTEREPIAILAMAGRFPGARNVEELWQNLRGGVESIRALSDPELLQAGVSEELIGRPNYVKVSAAVDGAADFDAGFFGYTPREAEITDPQQRVFLECAVEALERAGYDPARFPGSIGVFAGCSTSSYWQQNLAGNPAVETVASPLQVLVGNDKDFLSTRVAYKLNLRGPAVTVQTACSTSLAAVHMACESLLDGACDIALAGGVSIRFPQNSGYLYEERSIGSPDGHCRAFDADACGTTPGNGAGIVVLKRLSRAIEDRDPIAAVVRGSAINNDGSNKVGYTAPSIEGQADVVRAAVAQAGVDPNTITCIEAHGTGTQLGDPIEVAALNQVFGPSQDAPPCAIGSVKTNIGHLDAAAGVAGLIKAALQIQNAELVPSLHFSQGNEKIDFAGGRFQVNTETRPWQAPRGAKRRAGVSSFGLGGTNAHLIVEEAPAAPAAEPGPREWRVLPVSAKSTVALDRQAEDLAQYLERDSAAALDDVAFTLQVGRTEHSHRRGVVARNAPEAAAALGSSTGRATVASESDPQVVFLFPGQGAQFVGMGRELFETEATFRRWMSQCAELFQPELEGGLDLCDLLYRSGEGGKAGRDLLKQTWVTQPALFAVEYSLARLWMAWGVRPTAMIGHSVGEYVAACLAGCLTLEEATGLVAARGRLMQRTQEGAMIAAPLSEEEILPLLDDRLCIASLNAPRSCVVSGPVDAVRRLASALEQRGAPGKVLETTRAFHSKLMEPILDEFESKCEEVRWNAPSIRFVSNVTGAWIRGGEARDPGYWARHIRASVRFSDSVRTVIESLERPCFLEVGPGETLLGLARKQRAQAAVWWDAGSIPWPSSPVGAAQQVAETLGRLWCAGQRVDWDAYQSVEQARNLRRVPLPTYPFQRQRYWMEPPKQGAAPRRDDDRKSDISDWFYLPTWERAPFLASASKPVQSERWLVFAHEDELGERTVEALRAGGHAVSVVHPGEHAERRQESVFRIRPAASDDHAWLLDELEREGSLPTRIAHLWAAGAQPSSDDRVLGYGSLLHLGQALSGRYEQESAVLTVVTAGVHEVLGGERIVPDRALAAGPFLAIPTEDATIQTRHIDLDLDDLLDRAAALADALQERNSPDAVALRGRYCWVQRVRAQRLEVAPVEPVRRGVYLITGGAGGMGLELARALSERYSARLLLVGRGATDEARSRGEMAAASVSALGGEALFQAADVASRPELELAIARAKERFGPIQGVFHAAGVPGGGLLHRQTLESAGAVFAPKLEGTRNLLEVLATESLDFVILCSSQRSLLGAPGRVEYCAANAWLNASAVQAKQSGFRAPVVSIAWDSWRETGMGAGLAKEDSLKDAIANAEGVEVFLRTIGQPHPVVVVSTRPWEAVVADHRSLTLQETAKAFGKSEPLASHSRPELDTSFVAPRTAVEKALAEIWGRLLGIDRIGVDDNFFDLGGDSVVSIQVISQANEAGLQITPRQVFELQTIAELAQAAGQGGEAHATQEAVTGPLQLTPIQKWFFEQDIPERDFFHQAVLLETDRNPAPDTIERALQELVRRHDLLRTRFSAGESGWQAEIAEPSGRRLVEILPADSSIEQLEDVYGRIELERPPLMKAAFSPGGDGRPSRLLLAIHHLVVDLVSWRILIEDLETGCEQIARGQSPSLPRKTTSFQHWAARLAEESASGFFEDELSFWLAAERHRIAPLPTDRPRGEVVPTEASAEAASFELDRRATERLLLEAPRRLDAHVHEIVLAALAAALREWGGLSSLLVDLEGLGREAPFDDVDLSRTVGWFTPMYPVRIDCPDEAQTPVLAATREALRSVPRHGMGYGALRYLTESAGELAKMPKAEVCFLWQGQASGGPPKASIWRRSETAVGRTHAATSPLPHLISVDGMVRDDVASFRIAYSRALYDRSTIEGLAASFHERLRELVSTSGVRPAASETSWSGDGMADFDWGESDVAEIAAALQGSERPARRQGERE